MDNQMEIKEEPSWDEDVDLEPPLEVYLKTEFCEDQETQQQPGGEGQGVSNSHRLDSISPGDGGEFEDVDICRIQPDVLIHTPEEDPLQFPGTPSGSDTETEPPPANTKSEVPPAAEEKTFESQELAYSCRGCPMSYSTLAYLKTHERYCRKLKVPKRKKRSKLLLKALEGTKLPRSFTCGVCGQKTSTNSNYKQHLLLHTGEKPHKCVECGAGFARKADMNRHVLVHRGEKPYKCAECGIGFVQSAHLTQHVRIHTGVRPFVCDVCGDAFANKSNLTTHRRQHQRARPYECRLCGMKFAQSSHVTTHQRRMHREVAAIKKDG